MGRDAARGSNCIRSTREAIERRTPDLGRRRRRLHEGDGVPQPRGTRFTPASTTRCASESATSLIAPSASAERLPYGEEECSWRVRAGKRPDCWPRGTRPSVIAKRAREADARPGRNLASSPRF
jgi:hypothetical protein